MGRREDRMMQKMLKRGQLADICTPDMVRVLSKVHASINNATETIDVATMKSIWAKAVASDMPGLDMDSLMEGLVRWREELMCENLPAAEVKREENILNASLLKERRVNLAHYDRLKLGEASHDDLTRLTTDRNACEKYTTHLPLEAFVVDIKARFRIRLLFIAHRRGAISLVRPSGTQVDLAVDAYFLEPDGNRILSAHQFGKLSLADPAAVDPIEQGFFPRYFYRNVYAHKNQFGQIAGIVAAGIFLFAEDQLMECPEVFKTITPGSPKGIGQPPHEVQPGHEVELARTTYEYIDADGEPIEPPVNPPSGRKVNCPFYTVKGHWRKYKSGKIGWVNSYAKGSDRHNPEHFVSKTYV